MPSYGFIIIRHVNSQQTNKYWNDCVRQIRFFYPFRKIVIIDDNSNQSFIKEDFPYQHISVIQSEYPGRGELLPYIYYLKYKWFSNAVIIHDSTFIHKRIPFEQINMPVLPLWHHIYDKENLHNLLRICSVLKYSGSLKKKLNGNPIKILGMDGDDKFNLCFGAQSYINLDFLEHLENKYNLSNLVSVIRNRTDRCAFERIIGLLFNQEYPKILNIKSLFGNITSKYRAFNYNYEDYKNDVKNKKIAQPFVKVWTGR